VLGFQYRERSREVPEGISWERVRKFGLELHPEKTRLIEFGRYAAERRAKRGEGKPETFNFLGFTHICGKSPTTGYFQVYRKTIGKRLAVKLKEIRQKLRERINEKTKDVGKWLQAVVRGYYQYHAVPVQRERMKAFRHEVLRMWCGSFAGGSQRSRWTWKRFQEFLGSLIPEVEILHPYPEVRFASKHPR